jgi:hypothetical protein
MPPIEGATLPSIPTLVQKLDEIRQYWGKALLGHLNISVNLMIKPAPSEWTAPLEAITMRNGDCKAYSLAKYAGAQELGISADHVRLVIVHDRRHHFDHMSAAVYQNAEWFILDNFDQCAVAGLGEGRLRASRCLGLQGSLPLSFCFLG